MNAKFSHLAGGCQALALHPQEERIYKVVFGMLQKFRVTPERVRIPGVTEIHTGIYCSKFRIFFACKIKDKITSEEGFQKLTECIVYLRQYEAKTFSTNRFYGEQRYTGIFTDGKTWSCWHWPLSKKENKQDTDPIFENYEKFQSSKEVFCYLSGFASGHVLRKRNIGNRVEAVFVKLSPLERLEVYWNQTRSGRQSEAKKALQFWREATEKSSFVPQNSKEQETLFLQHAWLVLVARAVNNALRSPEHRQSLSTGLTNWISLHSEGEEFFSILQDCVDAYDWRRYAGDVLKGFYENLVSGQNRKNYGEYYTPDWLAAMMAERVLDANWVEKSVQASLDLLQANTAEHLSGLGVLDPCCGSGTFLYHALRRMAKAKALQGVSVRSKSQALLRLVHGIDAHPRCCRIGAHQFIESPAPNSRFS